MSWGERRHRLIGREIDEARKGLHLLLRHYLETRASINQAELAFRPYFRISEHVTNKPKYPDFTWDVLSDYLKSMEELDEQLLFTVPKTRAEPDMRPHCLKCGEQASGYLNIDEHGVCDECARREYRVLPVWCGQFRKANGAQLYCDHPELMEADACSSCSVYLENQKFEEEIAQ